MTTTAGSEPGFAPEAHSAPYWVLADTRVIARRQITRMRRVPDELVTTAVQPILFVVLFRYIFGGAIAVPGTSYVNYLMPGIMVQSVILGSAFTGIGIATDLQRGLIDRFRSLPMASSAVLSGRILADLGRSAFIVAIVWAVGLVVGFGPQGSPLNWLVVTALLLLGSLGQHRGGPAVVRHLGPASDVRQQRPRTDEHDGRLAAAIRGAPAGLRADQCGSQPSAQSTGCFGDLAVDRLVGRPPRPLRAARGVGVRTSDGSLSEEMPE
jgi:hypothetical protein